MIKLLFKKYFTSGLQILPEHAMEKNEFTACGTVQSDMDVWDLNHLLCDDGVPAEVRESSHYDGGYYVSVRHGEARITAEFFEEHSEFLLRGEGTGGEELSSLCKIVSVALAAAHIEHRIELYDEVDKLCHEHIYPPVA
jgi:hypothetical protein